jgi:opacity protein-like surface antigen
MKKSVGFIAILVLLLPCLGFSGGISFRLGYFVPDAKSDLWQLEFENMTFTKSNFQSVVLGFSYEHFFTRELSLVIGIDAYSQTELGNYRDYVGYGFEEGEFAFPADYEGEFAISHEFGVSITPVQVSLKLTPFGRRSSIIPYIGGGVSMYFWSVRLQGNIVDFEDVWTYDTGDGLIDIYAIKPTNVREQNRITFGFQGFAGVLIPFASRIALEAEFKYYYGKGSLEVFEGFQDFDLSGFQVSLGINYWF